MKPRFFAVPLFFLIVSLLMPPAASARPAAASGQGAGGGAQSGAQDSRPLRYDEKIVVTADREADTIGNVGSSVSIITRDEIAASGARWLVDVLQFAPGVSVVRSGPPGALTEVYLRGASSNQTLFLIDGIKANSPTSGSYDVGNLQLSADQIERIEIVRGPQSTLYGSQAIGGVINVITRRGDGPGTWGIEVDGGAYSTGSAHTWASGRFESLAYTGSVSYLDSAGFSAADEANGNLESDGYSNLAYNGRIDYRNDRGVRARGFVRGFDAELMFDGFGVEGPVDALGNVQQTREIYAAGSVGYDGERFSTDVEISRSDALLETATPDGFFTGFFLDSAIYEVDWQNGVVLSDAQEVTAGVEYRREQATIASESIFGSDGFDESVRHTGVYVQDRVAVGRAHMTAGVRFEDHSAFGSKWTGRFTAAVGVTDVVRLHGSVGSGFRAPTLNDLYFPGFSNPGLEPEESVGVDIGVEASAARARAGVTYFRNDLTNLIQFDFGAGAPLNIGEVLSQGVEIDGAVALSPELDLSGNYTWTRALPADSDDQLIRRPRHQGGVRLAWLPVAALRAWGEVRFKGGRFDSGAGGRVAMDAFALVNLAADYRVSPVISVSGRVDNLFDTDYEEILGFGTAGIGGYLGLTVTLSRR